MPARFLFAAGAALCFTTPAGAGLLKITGAGVDGQICLDFDNAVPSGNNGQYEARGLVSGGTTGGVCSNTWAVRGFSDAPGALFSGTYPDPLQGPDPDTGAQRTTPSDFTRGTSDGSGDTLGGLYGYDVSSASDETFADTGVDRAFGVRTGTGAGESGGFGDARPGGIHFRFQNDTQTDPIRGWEVSYDVYTLNDTARGGTLNFDYATLTNDFEKDPTVAAYTQVGRAAVQFADAADVLADAADEFEWKKTSRTFRFAADVARTQVMQFRWRLDSLGDPSRTLGDAFAIDNLKITAFADAPAAVPEPASMLLFGLCGAAGAAGLRRRKAK